MADGLGGTAQKFTLFHGSRTGIVGEIAPKSRAECDFGKGFYLGTEPTQPLTLICRSEAPALYKCELDLEGLKVHRFQASIDWALFIAYCRKRIPMKYRSVFAHSFDRILNENDVIFGKIANDIMDANRRDSLLFREILEARAGEARP